ncbi:hypothetical protein FRC04_003757 [Tulasnella sp. 424]|nr:hypothetical protein FRC04_003757 [Tulasnella sp. 424]KAG8977087.1 hypothetical protein FRC05_002609 [Tulasnella sp. 425]
MAVDENDSGLVSSGPADNILKDTLQGYATENNGNGIPIDQQLLRIQREFGIKPSAHGSRSKTVRMNNTVRDSPADMAQAIIDLKANDPEG